VSIVFDEVTATVEPPVPSREAHDDSPPRAADEVPDPAALDAWLRRRAWLETRRRAD